jgi:hypothetical protein
VSASVLPTEIRDWLRGRPSAEPSREQVAVAVARALGGDFIARMECLYHQGTGLRFAVVPGGEMDLGLTETDRRRAFEWLSDDDSLEEALDELGRIAGPPTRVEVLPFIVTVEPSSTAELTRLSGGEIAFDTPAWNESRALASKHGFRLPTEQELEWLRRDGGHASLFVELADGPRGPRAKPLSSRFGVELLHFPEWVEDDWFPDHTGAPRRSDQPRLGGPGFGVLRPGLSLPVQCSEELVLALAANRAPGLDDEGFVRDGLSRWAMSLSCLFGSAIRS